MARYYTVLTDTTIQVVSAGDAEQALTRAGYNPATFTGTIETTAPAGNERQASQAHVDQQAADRACNYVRVFGK